MRRVLVALLMLSLFSVGIDAATDVEVLHPGENSAAHEAHGQLHEDPGEPFSEHEKSDHFCHCAAHAPAVASSLSLWISHRSEAAPSALVRFSGAPGIAPPVRPPNLG